MKKFVAASALVLGFLLATATAQAVQVWNWQYSTDLGLAHGTFTTNGAGTGFEPILTMNGVYNGATILGLVATGTDSAYQYDNLFSADTRHFTYSGILFEVAGTMGRVNLFSVVYDNHVNYYEIHANPAPGVPYFQPANALSVSAATPVPEPATWALMLGGLALLAALRRARIG